MALLCGQWSSSFRRCSSPRRRGRAPRTHGPHDGAGAAPPLLCEWSLRSMFGAAREHQWRLLCPAPYRRLPIRATRILLYRTAQYPKRGLPLQCKNTQPAAELAEEFTKSCLYIIAHTQKCDTETSI